MYFIEIKFEKYAILGQWVFLNAHLEEMREWWTMEDAGTCYWFILSTLLLFLYIIECGPFS